MTPFLVGLVKDEPIPEKPSDKATCPYCGGRDLDYIWASHTLIGGGDGTRDGDPNHWWEGYNCNDCSGAFVRETKSGNVWYTDCRNSDRPVLKGFPSCYEKYVYTCRHCQGAVKRRYTKLDGLAPVQCLGHSVVDGKWVKDYRIFFRCEGCGVEQETERDCWRGGA